MKNWSFKKLDLILGIVVFLIALFTYVSTLEPTLSFWDCGEYIATSTKLQVGHPPGAPLFQMLGAFFAMFASSPSKIAYMVNLMSAIFSALTIMFLFWTIVHILVKYIIRKETLSKTEQIIVLGSSFIGALAFAFSDTFWFSAVEAEVYAAASFVMAVLFWMGLKWVDVMDQPRGNRWLILLAFSLGLSFGIHFMGLLVIPAIGMMYYFKKYPEFKLKQFIYANLIVFGILIFIFKMLLPWTMKFFSSFEIFFTNSLGTPFNTGTIVAGIVTIAVFYYGLKKAKDKNSKSMELLTLSVLYVLIGFSSWVMLPIRANADTVINENAPTNARELLAYYNREQYGKTYLFYGPYYSAYAAGLDKDEPYTDEKPKYEQNKKKGKYVIVNNYKNAKQQFSKKHWGLLPRVWSSDPENIKNYKSLLNIPPRSNEKPSFFKNIGFFFTYQLNYMYWRYLMWNFVGRQDDIQGRLDNHGNWLSGISFIDKMNVGSQKKLPSDYKNNKARNTYYFLPFILAVLGLLFHSSKENKSFYVVFLAFIMTGVAIIFYTNVRPFEPRERDYAVVGSFYFFSIWLGMGVFALYDYLKKFANAKIISFSVLILSLLAAPVLMATQNWDDHNRSHKYSALTNAKAYLDSCQKDAILYTVGDNDSFPLWYAQDVEGIRKDIRLVNTSLLQTDWYIDQQKRKVYDADPLEISMPHKKYVYGTRDVLYPQFIKDTLDIKDFVKLSLNDKFSAEMENGQLVNFYPSKYIRIPVNKKNVLKYGIVAQKDADKIVDEIIINIGEDGIYKASLAMLDELANNNWKRPIYFSGGSFTDSDYLWLKDYLQVEGLTYKLVPIYTKHEGLDLGRVNTAIMYKNVKKWDWGNMNKGIYLDPETRRNSLIYRTLLFRLANKLSKENKKAKAKEILDLSIDKMPIDDFGYYSTLFEYIGLYYKLGDKEKARFVSDKILNKFKEYLIYYADMSLQDKYKNFDEIEKNFLSYREVLRIVMEAKDSQYAEEKLKDFEKLTNKYEDLMKSAE